MPYSCFLLLRRYFFRAHADASILMSILDVFLSLVSGCKGNRCEAYDDHVKTFVNKILINVLEKCRNSELYAEAHLLREIVKGTRL